MKKKITALLLTALLFVCLLPSAFADNEVIVCNVGEKHEEFITTITSGVDAYQAGVPFGMAAALKANGKSYDLYIVGTPKTAGHYSSSMTLSDGSYYELEFEVLDPANGISSVPEDAPSFASYTESSEVSQGDSVLLKTEVNNPGGYKLSYEWYENNVPMQGMNSPEIFADTGKETINYYRCELRYEAEGVTRSVFSNDIIIKVNAASGAHPTAISLSHPQEKYEYTVGESFDPAGIAVRVFLPDGTTELISSGFEVIPSKFTEEGKQKITLSYQGCTCLVDVNVLPRTTPIAVEVAELPEKTEYAVGDRLSLKGLKLKLLYGSSEEIIDAYSDSKVSADVSLLEEAGKQTVTVTYAEDEPLTCEFKVTVAGDEAEEAVVKEAPVKPAPEKKSAEKEESKLQGSAVVVVLIAVILVAGGVGTYVIAKKPDGDDKG